MNGPNTVQPHCLGGCRGSDGYLHYSGHRQRCPNFSLVPATEPEPEPKPEPEPEPELEDLEPEPEFEMQPEPGPVWIRASVVNLNQTAGANIYSQPSDATTGAVVSRRPHGELNLSLADALLTSEEITKLFERQLEGLQHRILQSGLGRFVTEMLTRTLDRCRSGRLVELISDTARFSVQLPGTCTDDVLVLLRPGDEVEVVVKPSLVEPAHWVVGTVTTVCSSAATAAPLVEVAIPIDGAPPHHKGKPGKGKPRTVAPNLVRVAALQPQPPGNVSTSSPGEKVGSVVVASLDSRPLFIRARPLAMVLRCEPAALQGTVVQYVHQQTSQFGSAAQQTFELATVAAFLPQAGAGNSSVGRHLLIREANDTSTAASRMEGAKKVEMADLRCRTIVHDGGAGSVEPRAVLAPVGTHTTECLACTSRFQRSAFPEYCFGFYMVTGDSTTKRDPRHPGTLCDECLAGYATREAQSGKLHIKCPSCPRSLQMRDAKSLIGVELYDALVKRVAAAEKKHGADDSELVAAGLQCRSCPKCGTRIEKNAGCDDMDCYLCGHHFNWNKAEKIGWLAPVSSTNATVATRGEHDAAVAWAQPTRRRIPRPARPPGQTTARGVADAPGRAPPRWVTTRLSSPPATEPTFVPQASARASTISRLAVPRTARPRAQPRHGPTNAETATSVAHEEVPMRFPMRPRGGRLVSASTIEMHTIEMHVPTVDGTRQRACVWDWQPSKEMRAIVTKRIDKQRRMEKKFEAR